MHRRHRSGNRRDLDTCCRRHSRGDQTLMADLLVEGIDFYYENGLMVFTAEYLKKRGYCCRSGCRHCPYGYKPEPDNPEVIEK